MFLLIPFFEASKATIYSFQYSLYIYSTIYELRQLLEENPDLYIIISSKILIIVSYRKHYI